jgi:hypothetical protein
MFHALQQTDLTLPGKHNSPNQVCAITSRFPGKKKMGEERIQRVEMALRDFGAQ